MDLAGRADHPAYLDGHSTDSSAGCPRSIAVVWIRGVSHGLRGLLTGGRRGSGRGYKSSSSMRASGREAPFDFPQGRLCTVRCRALAPTAPTAREIVLMNNFRNSMCSRNSSSMALGTADDQVALESSPPCPTRPSSSGAPTRGMG